jgi:hypothetical protein
VPVERPDYKSNPLWTEAMALAHAAYAVAGELAEREPEEARQLRKAAVAVPARLAGALSAEDAFSRASDASEARAALGEVAERAERLATRGGTSRELVRKARALERSVRFALGQTGSLFVAMGLVPLVLAAALWLPSWWEGRELRAARDIAGVGAQLSAGSMTDARKRIDPGLPAEKIVASIGKPGFAVGTDGKDSRREIWTYYFDDGTLTINLTDGAAVRISTAYGPPRLPKKGGGY